MACSLSVLRYRVIRAKVCVALRNVQFPRLSSLRYTEWSRKVCVATGDVVHVPDSLRDTEICSGKCVSQVVWLDFRGMLWEEEGREEEKEIL